MKFALIALIATSAAFRLAHHNRPSGVTFFAEGGDISISDEEKEKEGLVIPGYELVQQRFATGMNGDEDLGQNIIMKGDKYHYNQAAAQVERGWVELPNCPVGDVPLAHDKSNASSATCK